MEQLGLNLVDPINQLEKDIKHIDYVGRNADGVRVFGIAKTEANGMKVVPDDVLQWNVPYLWSREDAISTAYAFSMAYYTMFEVGNIQQGEIILINAGCTPFAQACLLVAFCYNCKVYITVEGEHQKVLIRKLVPHVSTSTPETIGTD